MRLPLQAFVATIKAGVRTIFVIAKNLMMGTSEKGDKSAIQNTFF